MSDRYRLVFRGQYLPGIDAAEVTVNLAQLFGVTLPRIRVLLSSPPSVIKRSISRDDGNRYLEVLAEAGLVTHLELLTADMPGIPASAWDGIERRRGGRRKARERREVRRGAAIQPDRRSSGGRRSTD